MPYIDTYLELLQYTLDKQRAEEDEKQREEDEKQRLEKEEQDALYARFQRELNEQQQYD